MSQPPPPPPGAPAPRRASPLLPGGWIALAVLAVLAVMYFTYSPHREIRYDQLTDLINSGQVKTLVLVGNERAEGEVRDPNSESARALKLGGTGKFSVNLLPTDNRTAEVEKWQKADQEARGKGGTRNPAEDLSVTRREDPSWIGPFILNLLVIGVLIAILVFVFLPRLRDPMGGGFLNNYTRSPAKRYEKGKGRITFEDVAGMDNAKREAGRDRPTT